MVLGLAALDEQANPSYDRDLARAPRGRRRARRRDDAGRARRLHRREGARVSRPICSRSTPASVARAREPRPREARAARDRGGQGPGSRRTPTGVVTGRFKDGVVTQLAAGRAAARRAVLVRRRRRVCRHRVAVALAYPAWHAATSPPRRRDATRAPTRLVAGVLRRRAAARRSSASGSSRARSSSSARASSPSRGRRGVPVAKLPDVRGALPRPARLGVRALRLPRALACEHVVLCEASRAPKDAPVDSCQRRGISRTACCSPEGEPHRADRTIALLPMIISAIPCSGYRY